MKSKDETFNKFKIYKSEVENQREKKIKILKTNRGEKYNSNNFFLFCQEYKIIHEVTASYSL